MNASAEYTRHLLTLLDAAPARAQALRRVAEQQAAAEVAADAERTATIRASSQQLVEPGKAFAEATQFAEAVGAAGREAITDLSHLSLAQLRTEVQNAAGQWQHLDYLDHHLQHLEQLNQARKADARKGSLTRNIVLGAAGLATLGILLTMVPHAIGM